MTSATPAGAVRSPGDRVRRRRPATLPALVVAIAVAGVGYLADRVDAAAASDVLGPGQVTVVVDVEHSRFAPDQLRVRAGTLVRFEVVNHDPIHHELVVGPAEVHTAHEHGAELEHPPVPGEVSLGPNATGMTVYRFDEAGTVAFACHLPGHLAYGMVGEVEVVG